MDWRMACVHGVGQEPTCTCLVVPRLSGRQRPASGRIGATSSAGRGQQHPGCACMQGKATCGRDMAPYGQSFGLAHARRLAELNPPPRALLLRIPSAGCASILLLRYTARGAPGTVPTHPSRHSPLVRLARHVSNPRVAPVCLTSARALHSLALLSVCLLAIWCAIGTHSPRGRGLGQATNYLGR